MKKYTEQDILRLGKRYNNKKRTYLLIDPLQSKHIPVSPSESLDMMKALGEKVASKYPDAGLVIGFAETATAIGAAVASCMNNDCIYIHTTREELSRLQDYIEFKEEHSHAVEQKLYSGNLAARIADAQEIILVDDELSTGKTLINITKQLRKKYPELRDKKLIAVSIINRLTNENMERLLSENIECEYLVKLPETDYTEMVRQINIDPPLDFWDEAAADVAVTELPAEYFPDPRAGVEMVSYNRSCLDTAKKIVEELDSEICGTDDVLVLGTEEFMYPAIMVAWELENQRVANSVRCHSTTRSPIGVNDSDGYPVKNGYKIRSFYDSERETYIYNLKRYDKIIIITDSCGDTSKALESIKAALARYGNDKIFFVGGKRCVQYIQT